MKINILKHTFILTVASLIIRSINIRFNSFLAENIGASLMGIYQLLMNVYSLAVTFSSAGIRLATTRITVRTQTNGKNDINKAVTACVTYAGISGCVIGFILFSFSDIIGYRVIENPITSFPLKVLSVSLPFVAMSSSLGGFFTAIESISLYSYIQTFEQLLKFTVTVLALRKYGINNNLYTFISIVTGITVSELFSFIASIANARRKLPDKTEKNAVCLPEILRIALPDSLGTCIRSALISVEHALIPKCLKKSGYDSLKALSDYGIIHGLAIPVLLYPSAILTSLSTLLVPSLAVMYESGDSDGIKACVERTLKRTLIYSLLCFVIFFSFSTPLAEIFCKSKETAKYIKILSPLVPVMYTDIVTDGMLKGLDRQVDSMRFNIFDSALCIGLVSYLLPKHSVKGYIIVLYLSEIINFSLSIGCLRKICDFRCFQAHGARNSRPVRLRKCSAFPEEYEYQAYRAREKRSQDL